MDRVQQLHATREQLDAGLADVAAAPADDGRLEMLVRRPDVDEREVLTEGVLEVGTGLVGDSYLARGSGSTADGAADPEAQLNLMSSRAVDLVTLGDRDRWPLAGDQMFVDFDLSTTNAPTGTRLRVGTATIEVSAKPHNGCSKFAARFGIEAARWVNSDRTLRLRGINARVVEAGTVRPGDRITKVPTD